MIRVKTMKQAATSRVIPSFRSTRARNRLHSVDIDQQRIIVGCAQIVEQEFLRQRRIQMWQNRFGLGKLR